MPAEGRTADVLAGFLRDVMEAAARAQAAIADPDASGEGSAYRMALAAGVEPKGFYSVREVSQMTGYPQTSVYEAIREGDLVAVTPRGNVRGRRVSAAEVERWAAECLGMVGGGE